MKGTALSPTPFRNSFVGRLFNYGHYPFALGSISLVGGDLFGEAFVERFLELR